MQEFEFIDAAIKVANVSGLAAAFYYLLVRYLPAREQAHLEQQMRAQALAEARDNKYEQKANEYRDLLSQMCSTLKRMEQELRDIDEHVRDLTEAAKRKD